jgi:uncharacterized membrane protein
MKNSVHIIVASTLLVLGAGCAAGPIGPPLGLGPGLDQAVFWGLILIAALVLWPCARRFFEKSASAAPERSSDAGMQIAAERYAKGEINRDEYLKMIDDLHRGAA